jgi:integrase
MIELPPTLTSNLMAFSNRLRQGYDRAPKYLFQGRAGQHKPASTLSWLIKRKIKKHLGINMTAHQFRHVMGDLLVSDEPSVSSFETARQLLGHRNLSTTVKYYTGQNTMRAGRRHHELVQAKRAQATAASQKRIKRVRHKTSDAA